MNGATTSGSDRSRIGPGLPAGDPAAAGPSGGAEAHADAVRTRGGPAVQARARRQAAHLVSRLRDDAAAALRRARIRWWRSLQLRVVTATLVISAIVVAVLGFFLMQQIAAGLLQNKEHSAASQALGGLALAQSRPAVYSAPNGNAAALACNIADELAARDASSGSDYGVAVRIVGNRGQTGYSGGCTIGIKDGAVPAKMASAVESKRNASARDAMSVLPAVLPYGTGSGSGSEHFKPTAGFLFGAPLGNYYQLYYFFPLTQEQQNLALLQRTLLLVGAALVVLLAAIAALVTRWVVVPVRQVARAAQRLSSGNLDERAPVRGSDELAVLATSFNEMAAGLNDKIAELQNLSQVQRQFVSDVSHELRTPLTTIRIAADVLFAAKDGLDSSASRSAELLQSQLERFESLLTDLLEISRYDANAATLDAEPIDLCDLVRNSADVAQQLAERRGTKIEFRLPNEPCEVEADRRRVARILRNLLVNAVEHGESGDAVVTVAADRDAVAVAVRDFGVGLAPGEEHLVFDRFWRADPARARTSGGTGLGLSIALEDARLHGGWLEAWGEPGRGSVFRLTLPRTAQAPLAGSPLPLCPDEAVLDVGSALAAPGAPSVGFPVAAAPATAAAEHSADGAEGVRGNGASDGPTAATDAVRDRGAAAHG
jgi:two-component system, OmpR family, sensor histidine kinase MtrB